MSQVFLGVIVIGLIMGGKIIMESLKAIETINDEIERLRVSTQQCLSETEVELANVAELEAKLAELKATYKELEQKEKKINDEIQGLRNTLDGGR